MERSPGETFSQRGFMNSSGVVAPDTDALCASLRRRLDFYRTAYKRKQPMVLTHDEAVEVLAALDRQREVIAGLLRRAATAETEVYLLKHHRDTEALKDAPDARVPREPTQVMIEAAESHAASQPCRPAMVFSSDIWRAMYDAAMSAPAPEVER